MEILALALVIIGILVVLFGIFSNREIKKEKEVSKIEIIQPEKETFMSKVEESFGSVSNKVKKHPVISVLILAIVAFIIKKIIDMLKVNRENNSESIVKN